MMLEVASHCTHNANWKIVDVAVMSKFRIVCKDWSRDMDEAKSWIDEVLHYVAEWKWEIDINPLNWYSSGSLYCD